MVLGIISSTLKAVWMIALFFVLNNSKILFRGTRYLTCRLEKACHKECYVIYSELGIIMYLLEGNTCIAIWTN